MNIFENVQFIGYDETLTEGAKIDMALKNFLKEGKDYKGLKADLKDIIEANDLPKDDLRSKGKGFMHICKRLLQIDADLAVIMAGANTGAFVSIAIGAGAFAVIPGYILTYVISFIINRILRYTYDTLEFNAIRSDAEDCVKMLRKKANQAEDEAVANKFNSEADKLEKAIKKYSE